MNKINQRGSTLMEIMVSIIIVIIMVAAISVAFLDRKDKISLSLFRNQLIGDLRLAQVKSMNSVNDFGIIIKSANRYILFSEGMAIRDINLPMGITFTSPPIGSNIVFRRDGSLFGGVDVNIVITDNVVTRNVLINSMGLIN